MNSMYMYLFLQNQFKWILDKSRPGGSRAVTHERLVLKQEKTDPVNCLPEISFHRFAMRQLLRSPSHYNTESYGKSRTKYLISDCILGGSCRMEYTGVFLMLSCTFLIWKKNGVFRHKFNRPAFCLESDSYFRF